MSSLEGLGSLKNLEDAFMSHLKHIGLKDFKVEITALATRPDYEFALYHTNIIEHRDMLTKSTDEIFYEVLDQIIKPIEDSAYLKDVTAKFLAEVAELKEQINTLEKEKAELQKYKDNYELNFKMQHGENNE